MKVDSVVIGSGISGLTTAALLAKKGRQVVLIEKNKHPGGAIKRFVRKGVPFDVGFHYTGCLGNGEILKALWDYLKVLPALTVKPFPASGHDCLQIAGSEREIHSFFSYALLEEELNLVFPDEGECITKYLGTIRAVCDSMPFFDINKPITPFLYNFFGPSRKGLGDFLTSLTRDADLQAVLTAPAFLYGVSPRVMSLANHAMVAHTFYSGAYAIDGGGQAIVDTFLQVLTNSGVEIRSNCKAIGISMQNDKVGGVITDQGEIEAGDVVYTGHPTGLLDLVPEGVFRPAYTNRLRDLKNSCSMFIVFGTIKDGEMRDKLTWTNRYCIPSGLDVLAADQANPEFGAIMLTAPGRRDSNADETGSAKGVILMRPADWSETKAFDTGNHSHRPEAYQVWKREATDRLLDRAERLWGPSARITPLAAGTPLTFRDELGAPEGAVYGVAHNMNQFLTGPKTRVPGLWLSGQSTLMTGIVGSSLAGMITAGEILGLEQTWDEVRQCC